MRPVYFKTWSSPFSVCFAAGDRRPAAPAGDRPHRARTSRETLDDSDRAGPAGARRLGAAARDRIRACPERDGRSSLGPLELLSVVVSRCRYASFTPPDCPATTQAAALAFPWYFGSAFRSIRRARTARKRSFLNGYPIRAR